MLDINFIRNNPEKVIEACRNRQVDIDIDYFLKLDEERRKLIQESESIKAEQNKISRNISPDKMEKAKELKEKYKKLSSRLEEVEKEFKNILLGIPNIPLDKVPVGKDENDNKVIKKEGKIPKFDFKPKDHLEIGEKLDLIDTQKAAEVSGARFNYLKREAVLLEFALINYAFDVLTSSKIIKKIARSLNCPENIFLPVVPPVMIQPEVFKKTARISEENKEERYYLPKDNLYLIGSSEHTLGPLQMNEKLAKKNLPLRYVGFSTCFRREAGSYGQDTKGILRVHQFDKIEMESFSQPEESLKEHNFFVALQEYLIGSLKIPYQVVEVCTGDMGAPDASQIDIECWIPSQNKYRETHSADLVTDYQSRRLNIKIEENKKFVHMNDATAFAIGRTIVAILENFQNRDGSIDIPKVLWKYLDFKKII